MVDVFDRTGRGVLFVSVLAVTVALLAATGTTAAQSAPDCSTVTYDGDGTDANPYEVSNVDQLQCIEYQGLDTDYVQVTDINASETSEWNDGRGFEPIGGSDDDEDVEFTGTFDGNGGTITGLTIDARSTETDIGLFGRTDEDAQITNVGLEDVDITGNTRVGGLVGWNVGGTVSESYVEGEVTGIAQVGGLVGLNWRTVKESYAEGDVAGNINVGGLVGRNFIDGTVSKSYATGDVTGAGDARFRGRGSIIRGGGGLVGSNDFGATVSESYWDIETTGQDESDGGTGLTTSEMTGSDAPMNMQGFDFDDTWVAVNSYPVLRWQDVDESEVVEVDEAEGLPGFTVVTALLAVLTVFAAAVRRREG